MAKILYLIRGVSGSGKTTFAKTLGCPVFSADDYFTIDGKYLFHASELPQAHRDCQAKVESSMGFAKNIPTGKDHRIAVANTFTREWEMAPYYKLAEIYGYTVFSLIVETRHDGKNGHGVHESVIQKMRDRFEVKL